MLPHDLSDMFLAAGWRQPELYLNPEVRGRMSVFALADSSVFKEGLKLLKEDLNNGEWDAKYGQIRRLNQIDAGYRFLYTKVTD